MTIKSIRLNRLEAEIDCDGGEKPMKITVRPDGGSYIADGVLDYHEIKWVMACLRDAVAKGVEFAMKPPTPEEESK